MTSPSSCSRCWRRRALRLARPPEAQACGDVLDVVVLVLGSERLAIDVRCVQEIQRPGHLSRVPGVPPFWAGLANVRGHLYPVLDLRRYLKLSSPLGSASHLAGKVVLASAGDLEVGLLVDDATEVRSVLASEIGPPLVDEPRDRCPAITGVTFDLLSILDLDTLLADPALVLQDETI